jgi:hypothetical protein
MYVCRGGGVGGGGGGRQQTNKNLVSQVRVENKFLIKATMNWALEGNMFLKLNPSQEINPRQCTE